MHLLNVSNRTPLRNTQLNPTKVGSMNSFSTNKLATCIFFRYFVHFILGISIQKKNELHISFIHFIFILRLIFVVIVQDLLFIPQIQNRYSEA